MDRSFLPACRGARQDAARHREEAQRGDGEDHQLAEGERQGRRHGPAGAKLDAGRGAGDAQRRREALGRGGEGGGDSAAGLGVHRAGVVQIRHARRNFAAVGLRVGRGAISDGVGRGSGTVLSKVELKLAGGGLFLSSVVLQAKKIGSFLRPEGHSSGTCFRDLLASVSFVNYLGGASGQIGSRGLLSKIRAKGKVPSRVGRS